MTHVCFLQLVNFMQFNSTDIITAPFNLKKWNFVKIVFQVLLFLTCCDSAPFGPDFALLFNIKRIKGVSF